MGNLRASGAFQSMRGSGYCLSFSTNGVRVSPSSISERIGSILEPDTIDDPPSPRLRTARRAHQPRPLGTGSESALPHGQITPLPSPLQSHLLTTTLPHS